MRIPPHHWQRARRYWWDALALLALGGIVWGTVEYVMAWGVLGGLTMSALLFVAGYLAFEMLYPLWFYDVPDESDRK
jgi:hypothetical protein